MGILAMHEVFDSSATLRRGLARSAVVHPVRRLESPIVGSMPLPSTRNRVGNRSGLPFLSAREVPGLIDVETDKVVLELPAPADGVLVKILKKAKDSVGSGDVIAQIDTEAKARAAYEKAYARYIQIYPSIREI
jgi:multidrug efflux pump subunit AcrA (membrane-fusion protein)